MPRKASSGSKGSRFGGFDFLGECVDVRRGEAGKMLLECAVDEAVVSATALQEDAVAHGIQKGL